MESLFTIQIGDLIFYFIAFILSLSVHESAHALTSYWFGDDTGHLQGRISLNPMAHIDPIGTILIPLMGFLSAAQGLPPLIGWAKPVETNPLRWRNKDLANISVSAAGPISNFLLGLMVFIVMKALLFSGMVVPGIQRPFTLILPAHGSARLDVASLHFSQLDVAAQCGAGGFQSDSDTSSGRQPRSRNPAAGQP